MNKNRSVTSILATLVALASLSFPASAQRLDYPSTKKSDAVPWSEPSEPCSPDPDRSS